MDEQQITMFANQISQNTDEQIAQGLLDLAIKAEAHGEAPRLSIIFRETARRLASRLAPREEGT